MILEGIYYSDKKIGKLELVANKLILKIVIINTPYMNDNFYRVEGDEIKDL